MVGLEPSRLPEAYRHPASASLLPLVISPWGDQVPAAGVGPLGRGRRELPWGWQRQQRQLRHWQAWALRVSGRVHWQLLEVLRESLSRPTLARIREAPPALHWPQRQVLEVA